MSIELNKDQRKTLKELEQSSNRDWRIIGTYHDLPVVSNGLEMFALTPRREQKHHPGRLRVIAGSSIRSIKNGNV